MENPNPATNNLLPKKNINWHWLIKHPVEFSKNKHTPKQPAKQASPPGAIQPSFVTAVHRRALVLLYRTVFSVSNRVSRSVAVPTDPSHVLADDRSSARTRDFGGPAACESLRTLARLP